jgi:catechol 2,3-dioxygenase-like lactoylglutathione lyase family enzyme
MISGAHVMIFTKDEAADRAFLRDVLELSCIDAGGSL